jgi:hypothetical protein
VAQSVGVDAGHPALLHYAPKGSALDRIPAAAYEVLETRGQYQVAAGGSDNLLAILLQRLERHHGQPGLAHDFTVAFNNFLQTVDADSATPGVQPYTSPTGQPILTLADTLFFGPTATWPREAANQPYIEFWHRLDAELALRALPDLGPAGLDDRAWQALFSSGPLAENPALSIEIDTRARLTVQRQAVDQTAAPRPASQLADIGAIERP